MSDPQLSEVVALLRQLGATDEQLAAAAQRHRLPALAVDLTLDARLDLTPRQAAERLGVGVDDVLAVVRSLGLPPMAPDEVALTEGDLDLLALAPTLGPDLLRVVGSAMARVAEAGVADYVQTVERDLVEREADLMTWTRTNLDGSVFGMEISKALGSLFLHHLRAAVRWQRSSQADLADRRLARLAVGFVDLVGFTPLTAQLDLADLVELVNTFEHRAFELVSERGGRVVKHIGDEIMFAALDAGAGARIALDLLGAFEGTDIRPRGGLAFGEVLVRHGDYYGPVVNLASRLADEAVPGEVLVDQSVVGAAGRGLRFEPAGRRSLKGFADPVPVSSLGQ